jgi:hypothetical protein
MPLDGGRFFHLILFSRHRVLELAFSLFAALALIASAALGLWVLPVMGGFLLLGLPLQSRLRRAADGLRAQLGEVKAEPAELSEDELRKLFLAAREVTRNAPLRAPRAGANMMEMLLDRAAVRPPPILASVLLLVPWLAGLAASVLALMGLAMSAPPHWQSRTVDAAGFSIVMPGPAPINSTDRDTPQGKWSLRSMEANGTGGRFSALWYEFPPGRKPVDSRALADYLDRVRKSLPGIYDASVLDESPLPDSLHGRQFQLRRRDGAVLQARIVVVGNHVFQLAAPAEPPEEARRFFDSFQLLRKLD